MVRNLVFSFLFKGKSFSFVRGLWPLNLDNRKTFLVDIFWISFASGVLRWWLESLLLPSIWVFDVRSIYFFLETLSCLQEGDFNLGIFPGLPQLAWLGCVLYQGVFISINAIYDFILLFFCSICFFSWCSKSNMVDVCCARERAQWLLGAKRWA